MYFLHIFHKNLIEHKYIHNFYRWHGQNTTALTPRARRLDEVKIIYFYIAKIIRLTDEQISLIQNRYKYLLEHYFDF